MAGSNENRSSTGDSSTDIRCPVCRNPAESAIKSAEGTRYVHTNLRDFEWCLHREDGTVAVVGDFETVRETMTAPEELVKTKMKSERWELAHK